VKTYHNRRYLLVTADVRANLARLARDSQAPRQGFLELARALDAESLSFSDTGLTAPFFVRMVRQVWGAAGRAAVLRDRTLDSFVERIAGICRTAQEARP